MNYMTMNNVELFEKRLKRSDDPILLFGARDFNETEIQEINKYVLTNVPYSVLEQVFLLTEDVINKLTVFTTIYRIIKSCRNYVEVSVTKDKLIKLIKQCEDIHEVVYHNLLTYEVGKLGSGDKKDIMVEVLSNKEQNDQIDNLIDCFLVFAEKQKLFNLDKIHGIKSDTYEGNEIVEELYNTVD